MSLFVEYHLIQSFAPSNLNRDDTGSPKEAIFGGVRRVRVSSQCWKRAIRGVFQQSALLDDDFCGVRTKKLKELLETRLATLGRESAGSRIDWILSGAGLKLKNDGKTEYLLFLGEKEISALVELILQHWDQLGNGGTDGSQKSKKEAKMSVPAEIAKQTRALLNGGKAVDIALFGRMLADLPEANQDAACQVAHAISTHRVEREFDYFTAVDDKSSSEEASARMIGQTEFKSATFYRYALLDTQKLLQNLQQDKDLALEAIRSFTEALTQAIPSGKQNAFAAHNPPSFVGVSIRHRSPFNLANAFEVPITAKPGRALSGLSVEALAEYDRKLAGVYGDNRDEWAYLDVSESWPSIKGVDMKNLSGLSSWVKEKIEAEWAV